MHRRNIMTGLIALGVANGRLSAQTVQPAGATASPRREYESRSELEAQAKAAEGARRTGEAWLLRQRLEKGDFQDGDKIAWSVQASMMAGALELPDTLTVRAGRRVELGRMGELSLEGVLRNLEKNEPAAAAAKHVLEAETSHRRKCFARRSRPIFAACRAFVTAVTAS